MVTEEPTMSLSAKRESLARIHGRYQRAGRPHKRRILDEFCATCGYHRKSALRLLHRPLSTVPPNHEKAALEELLNDAGHRVEQWVKLSEQIFEFACTARIRFAKGDAKTKKEILSTIGSNLILKDKRLCIEAKKPFFILEKSLSDGKHENEPIEAEITSLPQRQKEAFASSCLTELGDLYDVRTLQRKNQNLVTSVYHFFRSECTSLRFRLSEWKALGHAYSMTEEEKNSRRVELPEEASQSPDVRWSTRGTHELVIQRLGYSLKESA